MYNNLLVSPSKGVPYKFVLKVLTSLGKLVIIGIIKKNIYSKDPTCMVVVMCQYIIE